MSGGLAVFIPLTLLWVGVANHLYQTQYVGLTPWKAGGFGMFSTVDSHRTRYVRITLMDQEGTSYQAAVPEAY
jgi:hypothetical protein